MKIERIKAVRELGELEFMRMSMTNKIYAAEQKLEDLGFKSVYDVYDFIRDTQKPEGTLGLLETKQFVERQFPGVSVEDQWGNNEGTFDTVLEAVTHMTKLDRRAKFTFYTNGTRVALLDLS